MQRAKGAYSRPARRCTHAVQTPERRGEVKKIISLFKRDYEGTRLVYDEIVEGAEWVVAGEGVATIKLDGTSCMVRDGQLYKRYDRKMKKGKYRDAPHGWEAAQDPDPISGHWPGWLIVGDGPEDQYHREAWNSGAAHLGDGTYELCGPKVQGNPEQLERHSLIPHGSDMVDAPRTFDALREWFKGRDIEGLVWHHKDGRMVKIKKKDFGLNRAD